MEQYPKLIGVCLSTIQDENRFHFVKALNKYAVAGGFRLLIFNSCTDLYEQDNTNNAGESSVFRLIPYKKLSAMVMMSNFIFNKDIVKMVTDKCRENGVPVFSIDKELEGCFNFSFSYADTFERICSHIIEKHGAKKLFMIAGIEGNDFSDDRIAAFRRSLEAHGLPFDMDNVGYGNFWDVPTNDVLNRWFVTEQRDIPDAIICANDTMAIAVSSYLQRMGLNIPDDCIVTGFDGIMQSEYHLPHLTTCKPDYDKMGRLLIDSVIALESGNSCADTDVGFNVIFSQSCGCEKIGAKNVNEAVQDILDRYRQSSYRQSLMCSIQSSISKMSDITELPHILIDKFQMHTNIFALNSDVLDPPDFGAHRRGENSFSQTLNVLYQRYFWNLYEPCSVSLDELLPDYGMITKRPEPIIICCLHFIDMVLGYCAFQPTIDFDEYEKMHTLISAIDASLGNFHGRMQIRSINDQLVSANDELQRLSLYDFMTGLFNRRGFFSELEKRRAPESCENGLAMVLISADLDGLKNINDNYGHIEGDNAISTVSRALLSSSVNDEICARFGGDEFCVAHVTASEEAEKYYSDFRKRFIGYLENYNKSSGKAYTVEASIGCYIEPIKTEFDLDNVIKIADQRMYADKVSRKKERRR